MFVVVIGFIFAMAGAGGECETLHPAATIIEAQRLNCVISFIGHRGQGLFGGYSHHELAVATLLVAVTLHNLTPARNHLLTNPFRMGGAASFLFHVPRGRKWATANSEAKLSSNRNTPAQAARTRK